MRKFHSIGALCGNGLRPELQALFERLEVDPAPKLFVRKDGMVQSGPNLACSGFDSVRSLLVLFERIEATKNSQEKVLNMSERAGPGPDTPRTYLLHASCPTSRLLHCAPAAAYAQKLAVN